MTLEKCISVSDHTQQRELLKPLIPLFLTAFTNTSQNEIKEKFGELANDFAGLCANALVREMEPKINESDKFEAAKSIRRVFILTVKVGTRLYLSYLPTNILNE